MSTCAFASGQNRYPAFNKEFLDVLYNRKVDIYNIYKDKTLPEFNTYVDRYCTKHKITPEIACQHTLIREAWKMYNDKSTEKKGEEENVRTTENYSDDRSC